MALGDRARHRHRDRAVAADGDGHGAGLDDAARGLLDALEGIENAPRRELDVAAVDDAERGDRIEVGVRRVEPADQRRLQPHGIRSAARADAEGVRAAVERQPEDGRAIARPGPAVGHAHEGQRQREQVFVGQLSPWMPPSECSLAVRIGCQEVEGRERVHLGHRLQLVDEDVLIGPAHVERGQAVDHGRHAVQAIPARVRAADAHVHGRRGAQHLLGDIAHAGDDLVAGIGEVGLEAAQQPPRHAIEGREPRVELLLAARPS